MRYVIARFDRGNARPDWPLDRISEHRDGFDGRNAAAIGEAAASAK